MGKQSELINVLRCICGVQYKFHPNIGSHGFLWLSFGTTPHSLLLWVAHRYEPNLGHILDVPDQQQSPATDWLRDRETRLARLKEHLAAAQNRMKLQADRLRTDRTFQVGDQVLLKLQPYVQQSVASRPFPKLAYKFFGPFRILEKIGSVAYKLLLPEDSQIHPVFHVSQLKSFTPDSTPVFHELPKLVDLSVREVAPEQILERRLVKKGNRAVPQVLIKWTNLPATAATWEDYYVVKDRFRVQLLGDKQVFRPGEMSRPRKERWRN